MRDFGYWYSTRGRAVLSLDKRWWLVKVLVVLPVVVGLPVSLAILANSDNTLDESAAWPWPTVALFVMAAVVLIWAFWYAAQR